MEIYSPNMEVENVLKARMNYKLLGLFMLSPTWQVKSLLIKNNKFPNVMVIW